MAQWDAPSPTLFPLILRYSFAVLSAIAPALTRFPRCSLRGNRDDHRDAKNRSRRRRRHALGHTLLSLLRDTSGSPRNTGLLLQSWIGEPGILPVGGGRTSCCGRRKRCVKTSSS